MASPLDVATDSRRALVIALTNSISGVLAGSSPERQHGLIFSTSTRQRRR
ncbi:MAG: hypothetical protein ACOYMW_01605 [Candidatus Competibacteraceae bacterium]